MGELSGKQKDLLLLLGAYGEPDWEPMTTWELFNMAQAMAEDLRTVEDPADFIVWAWDRGSIRASMRRLEERGLVTRIPGSHTGRGIPVQLGPTFQPPKRRDANYRWTFTDAGFDVMLALAEPVADRLAEK